MSHRLPSPVPRPPTSARVRAGLIAVVALTSSAGCGPKGRIRDNPFAEPPARATGSDPLDSADARAGRDRSRDLSTSPVTDATPAVGRPGEAAPFAAERPFPERTGLAARPAVGSGPDATPSASSVGNVSYASIRTRLDKAGAKNLRLETEPSSGKFFFRCEVPHPNEPTVGRVFETNEPAANELDAMLAVTLSVEEWVANPAAAARPARP